MRLRFYGVLPVLAAMSLSLPGCGDSSNPTPSSDPNTASKTANEAAAKMPPLVPPGKTKTK